VLVSSEDIH